MPPPQERTRDLYEELPEYAKPPLIPLPDPDDVATLELDVAGTKTGSISFRLLHRFLQAVGFEKFLRNLTEERLEGLLRRYDLRRIPQCPQTLSATANLADDPRELTPQERAATLLIAARQLHSEIRAGTLAQDCHGGRPLEMGQYPNLFGTGIIWEGGRRPRIFKSDDTSHINLAIGRRLYSLDLGDPETESGMAPLLEALQKLSSHAERNPLRSEEPSLGLIACAAHDTRRKAFRLLRKERVNRETLDTLKHGTLTLCLDLDHLPASDAEAARIAHSQNPGNRWHHSSLQLVVFGNAKACAIYKFDACIDGNTMTRSAAEIQKRAARITLPSPAIPPGPPLPGATELGSRIDPAIAQRAWRDVRAIQDNQRATFEIQGIGRGTFKNLEVNPVPAFILALHLTISHFTGKSARIEQLLTMSKYRCMGLTTAMVTTPEMESFLLYLSGGSKIHPNKADRLMREAIGSQVRECRQARSHLPVSQLIPIFVGSLKGPQKIRGAAIVAANRLLGIRWASETIVSHPAVYPEVPMLGRPGIRLPYVKYFALHYRMLDDGITVTMMPSLDWSIPNAEVIAVLEKKLRLLEEIAKNRMADIDEKSE